MHDPVQVIDALEHILTDDHILRGRSQVGTDTSASTVRDGVDFSNLDRVNVTFPAFRPAPCKAIHVHQNPIAGSRVFGIAPPFTDQRLRIGRFGVPL